MQPETWNLWTQIWEESPNVLNHIKTAVHETVKPSKMNSDWAELLCCSVCGGVFSEAPVSLPCGHTLCHTCMGRLSDGLCPLDSSGVQPSSLLPNLALLRILANGESGSGVAANSVGSLGLEGIRGEESQEAARRCLTDLDALAAAFRPLNADKPGAIWSAALSRPVQRKLATLFVSQLAGGDGRLRAARAGRVVAERSLAELLLLHQNSAHLSSNLWSAVRGRGCQFLGPAMQEEVLRLILLTLSEGAMISRKTLVMYIVSTLEKDYPQASKTSVGHVVQLLYRASCFNVMKRDGESSLMQLKEEFRSYEELRREHDSQIVQIAMESGLRISPDQWSSLLYGDQAHRSHMQSIMDKLQGPACFSHGVQELSLAASRSADAAEQAALHGLIPHFHFLASVDPTSTDPPGWTQLSAILKAVRVVVLGSADFCRNFPNSGRHRQAPPPFASPRFGPPRRAPPWQPRLPTPHFGFPPRGPPPPRAFPPQRFAQPPPAHMHLGVNIRPPNQMPMQAAQRRDDQSVSAGWFQYGEQPPPSHYQRPPPPQAQHPQQLLFQSPPPPQSPFEIPPPQPQFLLLQQPSPQVEGSTAIGVLPTMVSQTVMSYQPILLQPPASAPPSRPAPQMSVMGIEPPGDRKLRQLSNKRDEIVRRLTELDPMDKDTAYLSYSVASSVLNDFYDYEAEAEVNNRTSASWASLASSLSSIWLTEQSPLDTVEETTRASRPTVSKWQNQPTTVVACSAPNIVLDALSQQPVPTPAVQASTLPLVAYATVDPGILASNLPASMKGPVGWGSDVGVSSRIDRIVEVREALGELGAQGDPAQAAASAVEKEHLKWELHIVNKQLQATLKDKQTERDSLLNELEHVDQNIAKLK